jgi:integrase
LFVVFSAIFVDAGQAGQKLSTDNCGDLLVFASTTQHPQRNRLIVLLSVKAGLRAAEIANLTWEMVLTLRSKVSKALGEPAVDRRQFVRASL